MKLPGPIGSGICLRKQSTGRNLVSSVTDLTRSTRREIIAEALWLEVNLYLCFFMVMTTFREGNGTPLQYSCLENPMDGGAWWAAVHGVAQSRTRLKQLFMHWRRIWQPTPVFLPGESQGQRTLVGCHLWGHTESDTTEAT